MLRILRPFQFPRSDFRTEWLAVAFIAGLDAILSRWAGLQITFGWNVAFQFAGLFALVLAVKSTSLQRGGLMAEYFALATVMASVLAILSYMGLALSGPMIDAQLLAADRALGFDWMAGYNFLLAHPAPFAVLKFSYDSILYQNLYFCVLMSLMARQGRLREMFWLVFITASLASLGAAFFPALGPYKSLGMAPPHSFVPVMEHIKSGRNLVFDFGSLTGVVSFPSFHTAVALVSIWGFRRTGLISWAVAALNLLMIAGTPWFGGHYLVDMLAGAATAVFAIVAVHAAPRLWARYVRAVPLSTLAVAGE